MLPPPITIATCIPEAITSFTSEAMRASVGEWIPYLLSPISASPDNFRSTRLYLLFAAGSAAERILGEPSLMCSCASTARSAVDQRPPLEFEAHGLKGTSVGRTTGSTPPAPSSTTTLHSPPP